MEDEKVLQNTFFFSLSLFDFRFELLMIHKHFYERRLSFNHLRNLYTKSNGSTPQAPSLHIGVSTIECRCLTHGAL